MVTRLPAGLLALSVVAFVSPARVCAAPAAASDQPAVSRELRALRASTPPKVDGVLDDQVWSGQPLALDRWVSYNPLRGEAARQRTDVWVAYDESAIYFAFRCFDEDPGKIRATISRRDNAWNDDWVAVSLDSSRAGQVAYHMFTNASGIQMDALNSGANGEDSAPDWVWQSAGRVNPEGYVVEIRVPLESIRFRGGLDVRMGVMFFRRNSRLGLSWSWPEMPPGKWVFETHVPLVFDELHQPRVLEIIPSATMSSSQTRAAATVWNDPSARGEVGVSAKYGVTSTTVIDATINPDFSQVESDAFQVEVNQRFENFFSEKRPFFMEGLGLFNLAGAGGDATMRTAVHTRRIIEPSVGVKLTGSAGRQSFAVLSTADKSVPGEVQRKFTIGRAVRNYGQGQYVGALVTDDELALEHNRVAAVDFALRHGDRLSWNGALIYSDSRTAEGRAKQGVGSHASYTYATRRLTLTGQIEHYGRDFQMDTAFLNRVGVTRAWQYQEVQFYPDETRYGWLKRIAPFLWVNRAMDREQGGPEHYVLPGIRFNFTRQGNLRLDFGRGRETFAGREFVTGRARVDGGAQLFRWLNVGGTLQRGPGIFYEVANPFGGDEINRSLRIGLQPNAKLNHNLSYSFVSFERENGGDVFDVHIVNLRNTYQFNPQFLLRGIVQYDSSRRRVLGDFLASYELVPGTVVHAGYGSLLESVRPDPYRPTARVFFFKASYLARF